MIPAAVYCPKCHKRMAVPKTVREGLIKIASGFAKIMCYDKKCGGHVKIKLENKIEEAVENGS